MHAALLSGPSLFFNPPSSALDPLYRGRTTHCWPPALHSAIICECFSLSISLLWDNELSEDLGGQGPLHSLSGGDAMIPPPLIFLPVKVNLRLAWRAEHKAHSTVVSFLSIWTAFCGGVSTFVFEPQCVRMRHRRVALLTGCADDLHWQEWGNSGAGEQCVTGYSNKEAVKGFPKVTPNERSAHDNYPGFLILCDTALIPQWPWCVEVTSATTMASLPFLV